MRTMYSQPWSPIPSTTAVAPLLRTQKRSADTPLKYASPCGRRHAAESAQPSAEQVQRNSMHMILSPSPSFKTWS